MIAIQTLWYYFVCVIVYVHLFVDEYIYIYIYVCVCVRVCVCVDKPTMMEEQKKGTGMRKKKKKVERKSTAHKWWNGSWHYNSNNEHIKTVHIWVHCPDLRRQPERSCVSDVTSRPTQVSLYIAREKRRQHSHTDVDCRCVKRPDRFRNETAPEL